MKKITSILILTFMFQFAVGQSDTIYKYDGKLYRVYTSLADARKANPDSVFGLYLCCEGLKVFPNEVLKYSNLKFLSFYSNSFDDPIVYKKLTAGQRKKYAKVKAQRKPYHEVLMPYYEPQNKIKKIPDEINVLKKLEVLALPNSDWNDAFLAEVLRLEKLMPTTSIDPPSKAISLRLKWDKEDKDAKSK